MKYTYAAIFFCNVVVYPSAVVALELGEDEELVGYVQGDNQRDTIGLLLSCLATLALCVYTALHLNIPARKESHIRGILREVRWGVIGLFAPELVLYTAWRQYASAKQLCEDVAAVAKTGQTPQVEGESDKVGATTKKLPISSP